MPEDDVLSELLRPLRLQGVFFSKWLAGGRWAVRGQDDSCAVVHYMLENECSISFEDGSEHIRLHRGDLAVFPHGTAHTFADAPGREPVALRTLLPHTHAGKSRVVRVGSAGPDTALLCASLHYDAASEPALYRTLPRIIVLPVDALKQETLLLRTLESLTAEIDRTGPGTRLIMLRAFEMIFALSLRVALEQLTENSPALQALRHPGISKALAQIYTAYWRPWTVTSLAREAGMSRSAFAKVFRQLVGDTPARHLTAWRMKEAAQLLTGTSIPLSEIPEHVGYQSAVGFHLAFRNEFGTPPGEYRTARARLHRKEPAENA